MTIDDLNAINVIIDEFEGNTIMGKHIKKAVNAYFKQEKEKIIVTPIKRIKVGKHTIFNKEIETMSSSGEAITTRRADGFVPTAGKLRNDIQTAEKKWGKGENILRFSEEQYDTFSPSNFRTADDMLEAMGKKGAVLDFDFNVPDIAFANFRNRPEHLVELTTLHNIKKAIENNYDVVQFNTFNTQAKLSGWSESLFEGRRK